MQILSGVQSLLSGLFGRSQRALVGTNDGGQGPARLDKTNELLVENLWNSLHQLSVEGSLYVAQNATPWTGVTLTPATQTSYAQTAGIFSVYNQDVNPSLGGTGRDLIPLWLKFVITAAGTAGTYDHFAGILDKGVLGSGGTVQPTGVCQNPNYPANDTCGSFQVGVVTLATASSQARYSGQIPGRQAAAPAYIVGDELTFVFGGVERVEAQSNIATTASNIVYHLPAVVVTPGWSWALMEFMTARSSAQSALFEFGYVVR